jgi:hypothetical protein
MEDAESQRFSEHVPIPLISETMGEISENLGYRSTVTPGESEEMKPQILAETNIPEGNISIEGAEEEGW